MTSNGHQSKCILCSERPKLADGEFCAEHAEAWARTQGLISQLALPPQRDAKGNFVAPCIEVETEDGSFDAIETMAVDGERIVIGTKGGRTIKRTMLEGAPRWKRR